MSLNDIFDAGITSREIFNLITDSKRAVRFLFVIHCCHSIFHRTLFETTSVTTI